MKSFNTGKVAISYAAKGPADGLPLVFLHGATLDHVSMRNTFEPYFRARGARHRRIYPDFPGHGASGRPLERATMASLLEDTEAFLSGNFSEPPALVGYSLGGFVALKLAEKVRFPSLFLIAPPVCSDRNRLIRPEAVTVVSDELTEAEKGTADARYLALAAKRTTRTLKSYKANLAAGFSPGRLAFQARLFKGAAAENIGIEPGLIGSRTVFLTGRQDTLTGYRPQFELSSKLKNSEYHSFYDCGHFLPVECEGFGPLFLEWLRLGTGK
ncbi:MAG: alpha/beta hydrolase [Elusimicrobia bacterium]|nr:alpha/beta hydrolase [Elusimicrobiota bacterium]